MAFDVERIKSDNSVIDVAGRDTTLKRVSAAGEYAGPCPRCGGEDRFHCTAAWFFCRQCHEKRGDVIEYVRWRDDVDFRQACETLGGVDDGGGAKWQAVEPITLEQYAEAKRLPADFLRELGLSTRKHHGRDAVRIPYFGQDGREAAVRWRRTLKKGDPDKRFLWNKGDSPIPYGLERLRGCSAKGIEEQDNIFLVEGESDAQSLWLYGLPALGIPGADAWKAEWAPYLEGYTVYVWQEPDQGGEKFVPRVCESLPGAYVIQAPSGRKDPSECHVLGDDVPTLMEELKRGARPWAEIAAERENEEASEHYAKARHLLESGDVLGMAGELFERLGLVGEERIAKVLYLAFTSRILENPINVVVKGPSAGGKSYVVKTVLDTIPDSAYLDFTAMSDLALVYDRRPLAHRFVVLYEAAGLRDARDRNGDNVSQLAYIIRSLLSEGKVRYSTVVKGEDGMETRIIEREGPTGFVTTTTLPALHGENETRMLSLEVTDTPEQTRAICLAMADRSNGHRPEVPILSGWHSLQLWLQLGGVSDATIPYAHALGVKTRFPAVRQRRDFQHILTLIKVHALLNQRARERDTEGRIVASLEDYRAIHSLIADVVNENVEATVSVKMRETVNAARELIEEHDGPVTVLQVAQALSIDKSAASRRLAVARERGWLVNEESKRGRPLKLVMGEPLPAEEPILPNPDELAQIGQDLSESERFYVAMADKMA